MLKNFEIFVKEYETDQDFDKACESLTKLELLSKVHKRIPQKHTMRGYVIYLAGYDDRSNRKAVVVYQDPEKEIYPALRKFMDSQEGMISIGTDRECYTEYLGPFVEDFDLHAFFHRSGKSGLVESTYLQWSGKNYMEILYLVNFTKGTKLADKQNRSLDHATPQRYSINTSLDTTIDERSFTRPHSYEMAEVTVARRFYNNFRERLRERGSIEIMKRLLSYPTDFKIKTFNTFY